jgi:hypothetical protein
MRMGIMLMRKTRRTKTSCAALMPAQRWWIRRVGGGGGQAWTQQFRDDCPRARLKSSMLSSYGLSHFKREKAN